METVSTGNFPTCIDLCRDSIAGQYMYQTKNYNPPFLTGATTCVKGVAGNTPANCPVSAGVPLTDDGKPGSTACVTGVNGVVHIRFPPTPPPLVLSLVYMPIVPWPVLAL